MKKKAKAGVLLAAALLIAGGGMSAAGVMLGAELDHMQALEELGSRMDTETLENFIETFDGKHGSHTQDEPETGHSAASSAEASSETKPSAAETIVMTSDHVTLEADSVKNLIFEMPADEVSLKAWEKPYIQIDFEGKHSGNASVTQSGDTITINGSSKRHDCEVMVYYPEEHFFELVKIVMGAGEIELCSDLKTSELAVEIGAGEFEGKKLIKAERVKLQVGAGEISVHQLDSADVTGKCELGELNITLTGKESDYQYRMTCGLGKINVGGKSPISFSGRTEEGGQNAERKLNLECGLGEIDVEFTD